MTWGFLSKLASAPVKEILAQTGKGIGSVMNRIGFTEKMSESDRMDKILKGFNISEKSTDSARQMAMTEMRTQKQPWLIRFLNGLIRPFGGIGALTTEFYAMWAENLSVWFNFEYRPVTISIEQHIVLGTIIAFYFGSRLKETLTGSSTKR
ncbi:MAG: hypothetical protein KAJ39_02080 [Gammaproteobacteria bacterium]|nr:hypothetical protein [Gammaproteobacteria bacterium]